MRHTDSPAPGSAVSRRFIKFLFVSGIAAVANIVARMLFSLWMAYAPAIVLAFCIGLGTAFCLNRLYVFRQADRPVHQQAVWFTVVNLAAVLQTLGISLLLADLVFPAIAFRWYPETVAHVLGVAAPVMTSYFGHKHFTFRTQTSKPGSR